MNEQEFVAKFSGEPWDLDECAEKAKLVEGSLADYAKAYLDCKKELEDYLEEIGYEFGRRI